MSLKFPFLTKSGTLLLVILKRQNVEYESQRYRMNALWCHKWTESLQNPMYLTDIKKNMNEKIWRVDLTEMVRGGRVYFQIRLSTFINTVFNWVKEKERVQSR